MPRRPVSLLLLLAALVVVARVTPCSAAKEGHRDGHPKVPKQHHRSSALHQSREAEKGPAVDGKKTHHPAVASGEGPHRAALRSKAPGLHHRTAEHHVDKHAKHRLEVPKGRLEVQKPPKPFLQPPLLHEGPPKHHAKQDRHH